MMADFNLQFKESNNFTLEWGEVYFITPDPYPGPYEVTPSRQEQTLGTTGMAMLEDVTIRAIPYIEVPNEYGTTVKIAP